MRVLILACLCCLAFGGAELKELKETNKVLRQALREIKLRREARVGEASMKVAMKNQEKSVGVTYEDKGSSGMCYTEVWTVHSSCQPGHNMIKEDWGLFYAMWCCKPKSSREARVGRELQVGGEICTQADLDRGCEQWRACVCPPSEGKASMKVAMKNLEKSVGVSYEEVSPYGTCYLEQATYSDCLAGHDKHIEDHVLFRVQWCCKPNSSPSTSDNSSGSISWFVGQAGDGKSCDAICGDHSKRCDKEGLQIQTKTELSSVCQQLTGWSGTSKGSKDIRPHTNVQTKACYGYDNWDSNPASCSAVTTDSSYARICACI